MTFATEHNWDSLDFFDGVDGNAPRLGSYSGKTVWILASTLRNQPHIGVTITLYLNLVKMRLRPHKVLFQCQIVH